MKDGVNILFAVIRINSHQYQVRSGSLIMVQKLDYPVGTDINLQDVLMIGHDGEIATEKLLLERITVRATVLEHKKLKKIVIFKMRRRCGYKRWLGYRPNTTVLRIKEIVQEVGVTS